MIYRTLGIVFKTIKFSESSVVSKIYTERFGIQSYMINGVRTAKSGSKANMLQSLSLLDMEVYHRENANLNRVKEFRFAYVFTSIPFDLMKGSVGLFMIEVLNKSVREEESNEALFHFVFEKIRSLDKMKYLHSDFLIQFLMDLSAPLGFFPNGSFSPSTPYFDLKEGSFTGNIARQATHLDESLSEQLSQLIKKIPLELSTTQRKRLLEALLQYYQVHVPNFTWPKSLKVLEEVFRH